MISFTTVAVLGLASLFSHVIGKPALSNNVVTLSAQDITVELYDIDYNSTMVWSTPAHLAVFGGQIEFSVLNSRLDYITHCKAVGRRLNEFFYGDSVYECESPTDSSFGEVTTFTFERQNNRFTLNQTWFDTDTQYVLFGEGSVDLECSLEDWMNTNWVLGDLYRTESVTCLPGSLILG